MGTKGRESNEEARAEDKGKETEGEADGARKGEGEGRGAEVEDIFKQRVLQVQVQALQG